MSNRPADTALIGQPGSRAQIPTPAAVLDLDAFERNIAKMAARAKAAGLALRPHSKSHKTSAIAHRQIEAGAVGICCAKLAEAEAMAAAGVDAILVTSPIAGAGQAERAAALAQTVADFRIVVDHSDGAAELGAAAQSPIQVLIDVDPGMGRTGVHDAAQAVEVFHTIAAQPNLTFLGVQCYGGHWQHIAGANARAAAVADGMAYLTSVIAALRAAGAKIGVVTGGGTGSFAADAAQGVLTEVQPGSYPFMDRDYREALQDDPDGAFEQSLVIATTVITANHPDWVTVDGGLKAFSTDGPLPVPLTPKFSASTYGYFGDEHGRLRRPDGALVARGERVDFAPGHIDPTLDRYDIIHMVRGDVLVEIAPVEARGASQ
ncbi:alanine racemase [Phenylobacterium sp.]|jgi:D-serine deaminase-like pyridoxal phosphate-dependent protein|uniref:alanine racemase n=1 Tax=Phenylobacterium sp. TaxID=1871053 RepID=UPI00120EF37A|nr:alanine racemase [Phenylobacterium sp.]THD57958.1 MAG: DSD1 family PLP-dependent enzyme [Phenylobacterium sp.]